MDRIYKDYLFARNILVNDTGEDREDCLRSLFTLARVFGIRVTKNAHLACWAMVETASEQIGQKVPQPFYQGFPRSVLSLNEEQLVMDQMIHYVTTYGLGDFSHPGHSLFEENFERLAFSEEIQPRNFEIVDEKEAETLVAQAVSALLQSTRPVNPGSEQMLALYAREHPESIAYCAAKDTAFLLIHETGNTAYARFVRLPDVIAMAEDFNVRYGLGNGNTTIMREYKARVDAFQKVYARNWDKRKRYQAECRDYETRLREYEKAKQERDEAAKKPKSLRDRLFPKPLPPLPPRPVKPAMPELEPEQIPEKPQIRQGIRRLNLRNQDRKLISRVIDTFFETQSPDIRDCYEKRRAWQGLLHQIHYQPKNERSRAFARAMRGKGKNLSSAAGFEAAVGRGETSAAAQALYHEKGGGAVARHLDYLISRSGSPKEAEQVLDSLKDVNLIILLQMYLRYARADEERRVFRFVKHRKMTVHIEQPQEAARRGTRLPDATRERLQAKIMALLEAKLKQKSIGKLYAEDGMERIALPLQEGSGMSGPGVLPKGSRVPIPEGKKIRCFTYWEKTDDIDLACFGLKEEGDEQTEFSWRTMHGLQSEAVVFSGDETSGYEGGSEYFDISIPLFRAAYPDVRYVVFTDNIYYGARDFASIFCKAGFMLRDEEDSGEIFEPRTVHTSFQVTAQGSTFACLFALDLKKREMIWLNMGLNSHAQIAGTGSIAVMRYYFNVTDLINVKSLLTCMVSETVATPEEADIILADHYDGPVRDGQTLIRSCDYEKILKVLN